MSTRSEFFASVDSIRQKLRLLEDYKAQMAKCDLLTPEKQFSDIQGRFDATCQEVIQDKTTLSDFIRQADQDDSQVYTKQLDLISKQCDQLSSTALDISDARTREEESFQERVGFQFQQLSTKERALWTNKNVATRHDAVVHIEKDCIKLSQLFNELHAEVMMQEQPIKNAEMQIETTAAETEVAVQDVSAAVDHQRRSNKSRCLLIWVAVAVIITVTVAITTALIITRR